MAKQSATHEGIVVAFKEGNARGARIQKGYSSKNLQELFESLNYVMCNFYQNEYLRVWRERREHSIHKGWTHHPLQFGRSGSGNQAIYKLREAGPLPPEDTWGIHWRQIVPFREKEPFYLLKVVSFFILINLRCKSGVDAAGPIGNECQLPNPFPHVVVKGLILCQTQGVVRVPPAKVIKMTSSESPFHIFLQTYVRNKLVFFLPEIIIPLTTVTNWWPDKICNASTWNVDNIAWR